MCIRDRAVRVLDLDLQAVLDLDLQAVRVLDLDLQAVRVLDLDLQAVWVLDLDQQVVEAVVSSPSASSQLEHLLPIQPLPRLSHLQVGAALFQVCTHTVTTVSHSGCVVLHAHCHQFLWVILIVSSHKLPQI